MTDDTTAPSPDAPQTPAGPQRASLGGRWKIKMGVFLVLLFGLGVWGLVDAIVIYPARGEKYASWQEWQYLLAASDANREAPGVFIREASVPDPAAALAELTERETMERDMADAGNEGSRRTLRATMRVERRQWLESLQIIGELDASRTTIDNPSQRLRELDTTWETTAAPKKLAWFDLPLQWLFAVVGFGAGLWLLAHIARVAARKYVWHPGEMRLELPGGHAFVPDQIEVVDKRKWDKFIVFLKSKPDHPTLKGAEAKVDTYQHPQVEEWILEMEREAFGDQEDEDAAPQDPGAAEDAEPAGAAG